MMVLHAAVRPAVKGGGGGGPPSNPALPSQRQADTPARVRSRATLNDTTPPLQYRMLL